jgi:predicted ATPase/class 3 adenylate cyclase
MSPRVAALDENGAVTALDQSLPSGVVTFAFTDIEASTRLLRSLEDRYPAVLQRHIDLIREAWIGHHGVLLDTAGDGCFGAFADAAAAIRACRNAQQLLATEPWTEEERPLVRMGIHTGLATPQGSTYVALAVHQAARVMGAAHGDQILVSDTSVEEAGALDDVELKPMGRFRMRDFDAPARLYSVVLDWVDREFPAVRAFPVDGHNLVAPSTSLVGRDDVIALASDRLRTDRLVTLTGPGGVGKTRVAIATGLTLAPQWEDGVWLVDLAPLSEGPAIRASVASVIGATAHSGDDWRDALDHLRDRQSVLLFDNCEHVTREVGHVVTSLLAECPRVHVLATSREPLGVAAETILRIDPLEVPAADAADVAKVLDVAAVRLFLDRARAARPDFPLDHDTVDAVIEIGRHLDGLPLALELAAAHASLLSPTALLGGLRQGLGLLRSRGQDRPDRQRTMDAVFDWSYGLLDDDQQAALRGVSVFAAGFTLESAAAAIGDAVDDVPGAIWALADASLVTVDLVANDTRYRMLETVRTCARRRLDDERETHAVASRLAAWLLERTGPWHAIDRIRSGQIADDLDTLRGLVPLVAPEQAQLLACCLGRYFWTVHPSREHTAELAQYTVDLALSSRERVSMLATLAMLQVHEGDFDGAKRAIDGAIALAEAVGGPPAWDDICLERVPGELALRSGDYATAVDIARGALERDLSLRGRARMYNLLGIGAHFLGDNEAAMTALGHELEVARRLGDEHLMATAEGNAAELALQSGNSVEAARHQDACLDFGLALGDSIAVAYSLIVAARLRAPSNPEQAAQLHAKADQLLADAGSSLYEDDVRASNEMVESLRRQLDAAVFTRALDAGRAMNISDAASLAKHAFAQVLA